MAARLVVLVLLFCGSLNAIRIAPLSLKSAEHSKDFIWFLHFHRHSGTSICKLAIENGEILAPYEPELHGHIDLGPDNIVDKNADQIVERLTQLRDGGVSFGSTEHWFPDPSTVAEIKAKAPWIKFITVLRDPVSRSISSFRHHLEYREDLFKKASWQGFFAQRGGKDNITAVAEVEANQMTRLLNGQHWPVLRNLQPEFVLGQVEAVRNDADAVEKAEDALRKFDLVLFAEKLSEKTTADLIREKLGWQKAEIPKTNGESFTNHTAVDQDFIKEIQNLNAQDYEIYNWASNTAFRL